MIRKHLLVAALLIAIPLCMWTGYRLVTQWFKAPLDRIEICEDRAGVHDVNAAESVEAYFRCIDAQAKLFIEKDYAESKDLGKAFLTLLTAVLVASITFSEKIVDVNSADWWARGMMIACWVLLLGSIICCGTGLAFITTGAGIATYTPHLQYREIAFQGMTLFVIAGVLFVGGMLALLIAGVMSLYKRSAH